MDLSRVKISSLFFTILILFLTPPVLGAEENVTEMTVNHQVIYDVFLDDETGTYSANVTSYISIYSEDDFHLKFVIVEITTYGFSGGFSEYHRSKPGICEIINNHSKFVPINKSKKDSVWMQVYEIAHKKETIIGNNEVKLLAANFTVKNISRSLEPHYGNVIAIPHSTYMISCVGDKNTTDAKRFPTRIMINLPYDDYNHSEFLFSSIPEEDVYTEGKRVTVILPGIEKYTKFARPFLLFFAVKEDESKKALDNITMNSVILAIYIAIFTLVIGVIFSIISPFIASRLLTTLKIIKVKMKGGERLSECRMDDKKCSGCEHSEYVYGKSYEQCEYQIKCKICNKYIDLKGCPKDLNKKD